MKGIIKYVMFIVILASTGNALAGDVPGVMTNQGILRNAAGDVVNGVYALTFKLYDQQADGQMLWSEVHNNVAVENGLYASELGGINPFPNSLFKLNSTVWLGISVEGQQELPRVRVTTVSYAFNARSAMVADQAESLDCTGCITDDMLDFDVIGADDVVQTVKDSGDFVSSNGGTVNGDLGVTGTVNAAVFVGDGSGLTGISSPQGECAAGWFVGGISALGELQCMEGASAISSVDGLAGGTITGDVEVGGALTVNGLEVCTMDMNCGETLAQLTCEKDQVAKWDGDSWVCSEFVTEFDPSALPADGLNEVSNDLLSNQFIDTFSSSGPTPIPDNNPTGVVDTITVPDIGTAQSLTVSVNITNSNLSEVKVILYAPNNNDYVLYNKNGPGQELGATYPDPEEPLSGDLLEWVDENPKGNWQLEVIDTDYKDNNFDGQINAWSIQIQTLSSKKVLMDGDLYTTGDQHVTGDLHLTGNIIGADGMTVNGNFEMTGSLKVGDDTADCDADKAGSLRYNDARLQWCNGSVWNNLGEGNAMFRWAQWSTYGQAHGQWYGDNSSTLFGGVVPQQWGDGNKSAQHMSSNSEILRTLFWRKGPSIGTQKNAMVMANEWYYYSSTNSRHTGALFRIRNTTDAPIDWTVNWYRTGYGGYNEYAGLALNGTSIAYWSNDFGPSHESSNTIAIPADRTSTVIFIAASSSPSGSRSNFLAFYNNCLDLPDGLEYIDDLDYKPDGWNN
jgi:subtilisin-like proprotein convertase family protein